MGSHCVRPVQAYYANAGKINQIFIKTIVLYVFFQVWDAISNEVIHFNHPNFNDKVACIVENDLMLEALYKQLTNLLNVQVKNESRLESCKLPKDGSGKSEVSLKSGEQFSCDLLVSNFTFY